MSDKQKIPREFFSEYTELPFSKCIDCDCDLFDDETVYTIIKHVVGTETVFEMAICMTCAAKMRQQYSEETAQNIQKHIDQKLRDKLSRLIDQDEFNDVEEEHAFSVQDGLSHCVFCDKARSACHRYEMVGLFMEDDIILQSGHSLSFSSPMMLCEDCNSEVGKLISQKTRDLWDRFVEEHFDGPPGIEIDGPKFEPILF